jgi:hypothetical protein
MAGVTSHQRWKSRGGIVVIVSACLYSALALKLLLSGLFRSHSALLVYCLVSIVRLVGATFFRAGTNYYAYWWMATEVFSWLIYVVLVLDVQGRLFDQFPGLATFSRRFVQASVILAVGLSLVLALPEFGRTEKPFPVLAAFLAVQRAVLTSLVIFLLLQVAALVVLRLPLRSNTVAHTVIFFFYFLFKAWLNLLLDVVGFHVSSTLSTILLTLSSACVVGWIILLTPRGEAVRVRVGHQWDPERGEQLVEHLASINASLSRSGRK